MPWPDFATVILDMREAIGRIEGRLHSNSERLDRMDRKFERIEDRIGKQVVTTKDFLPWIYGIVILGSVVLGKLPLQEALALIKSGH